MASGTDASIFGYGSTTPDSNVGDMANKFNSHFSGTFGSNEIPTAAPYPGIGPGSLNPTTQQMLGGKRRRHRHGGNCGCDKLFGGKRRTKSRALAVARSMSRSLAIAGGKRSGRRRRSKRLILGRSGGSRRGSSRRYHGGRRSKRRSGRSRKGGVYQQFMSNIASTPGYAVGAPLTASTSALASPPPIEVYNHSTTMFSPDSALPSFP